MGDVTEDNRAIARAAAAAFGTTPSVARFWDAGRSSSIAILECADSPATGLTSCSTVGLSDHSVPHPRRGDLVRTEIVSVGNVHRFERYPNVIATAAFYVINDGFPCEPGAVFLDSVAVNYPDVAVAHLLFVQPYSWQHLALSCGVRKATTWVQAVPISEGERRYVARFGPRALQSLFTTKRADLTDLHRPAVVE